MRRTRQELPKEETLEILKRNTSGVLALCGMDKKPYAVPLSYVYANQKLYFHVALEGYKLELLNQNPNASFCVIDKDEILPEKFTTKYKSVIVQGKITVADEHEKRNAITHLAKKYSPDMDPQDEIDRFWNQFLILVLEPATCTGKQGIELVEDGLQL